MPKRKNNTAYLTRDRFGVKLFNIRPLWDEWDEYFYTLGGDDEFDLGKRPRLPFKIRRGEIVKVKLKSIDVEFIQKWKKKLKRES